MLGIFRSSKVKSQHLESAAGRPRPAWRAPVALLESVPEEPSDLVWVEAGDGQEGGMWARRDGREASPETIADATAAAAATPNPFYGRMDGPAPIAKKRPLPKNARAWKVKQVRRSLQCRRLWPHEAMTDAPRTEPPLGLAQHRGRSLLQSCPRKCNRALRGGMPTSASTR